MVHACTWFTPISVMRWKTNARKSTIEKKKTKSKTVPKIRRSRLVMKAVAQTEQNCGCFVWLCARVCMLMLVLLTAQHDCEANMNVYIMHHLCSTHTQYSQRYVYMITTVNLKCVKSKLRKFSICYYILCAT